MNIYDNFKAQTIDSTTAIQRAADMRAVSADFKRGFEVAMWEAREIFMSLEDELDAEKLKAVLMRGEEESNDETSSTSEEA